MSESANTAGHDGVTLAAAVRAARPDTSWSRAKELVVRQFVLIDGEVCRDPARRLNAGERVEVRSWPVAVNRERFVLNLRHVDEHVVVVEKPSGLSTVRHPAERDWSERRKA